MSTPDPRTVTRPTGRALVVLGLVLFVYAAGANVGSSPVIMVAAGIATGAAWSVAVLLARGGRTTVVPDSGLVVDEGLAALGVTVTVPAGVVGVVSSAPTVPVADQATLLRALGTTAPECPDGEHPVHAAVLPVGGGTSHLLVPTVLRRGLGQPTLLTVELWDLLGLVRRRQQVPGPVVDVVPVAAGAEPFRATSHEEDLGETPAHALDGSGLPDAELRAWRTGEPIRAVHWPASMRTGELLLRPRAPETRQRRTLGVADGVWDLDELDARCREVWATACRLTAAGVEVEIVADGRRAAAGPDGHRLLASLPPNAGSSPRALGTGGAPSPR